MTKERLSITLAKEVEEAIRFLASAKQMSISEFVSTRLRDVEEVRFVIKRFQNLPEDPIIDVKKIEGEIGRSIPSRISSKSSTEKDGRVLLADQ